MHLVTMQLTGAVRTKLGDIKRRLLLHSAYWVEAARLYGAEVGCSQCGQRKLSFERSWQIMPHLQTKLFAVCNPFKSVLFRVSTKHMGTPCDHRNPFPYRELKYLVGVSWRLHGRRS